MNVDINQFSEREKDVIEVLLQGKSNKEIALELGISTRTVEFHLGNIYAKLGVSSRVETILQLSESHLGESAGDIQSNIQVKSTVDQVGKSGENGIKTILRRMPMKNLVYIVGGGLLIIGLVVVLIFANIPAKSPTVPIEQPSAINIENPTKTSAPSPIPTATLLPTATTFPAATTSATLSSADIAHFVSENYPDGTKVEKGTTITKSWVLLNNGTTTWTEDYALLLFNGVHPLEKITNEPIQIQLPKSVNPGETVEISANFPVPDTNGIYEFNYRFLNASGLPVSGDGGVVWLKFTVGNVQSGSGVTNPNDVTMTLVNVQKDDSITNIEICAQLPDTQDWNLNGVALTTSDGQYAMSGYSLKNAKDANTYSNSYRCYIVRFPVGVSDYDNLPLSVSIMSIRVPAENNLEANCVRAKQELASQYPGLDFTCGPVGLYYTNPIFPPEMSQSQADKIIMDALEQAIYGNWLLSE
ncbi:MAG: LuxR C-terminal-related transcriptional regulator [Anaerolineaceae bacterium]|nr:LuxR C-terminal-related transcriptional regulator [Anaerolineaceae bacterium]